MFFNIFDDVNLCGFFILELLGTTNFFFKFVSADGKLFFEQF